MRLILLAGAAVYSALAAPASAQTVVKVAEIVSAEDCTRYQSWGGGVVSECEAQFPELRERIQSAILESGRLQLATTRDGRDVPAPQLVVTGRVTGLGLTTSTAEARDYCVSGVRAAASLDLRVRDARSGRVVFGGTLTRSMESGSNVVTGRSAPGSCGIPTPSVASYGRLQRELALAAARTITFHVSPLRIASTNGRSVVLNYGGAMVPLGTIVMIASDDGHPVRYRVTAATPASADAEPMGDVRPVSAGAIASVVESDDPAANGRRYQKVELP